MPGQVATVNAIPDRYEVEEPSMSESSRGGYFCGVVSMICMGCVWMCASSWYRTHVSEVVESRMMKVCIY